MDVYLLVWVICAYTFYRLVKAELLIYRIRYHRSENKPKFIAVRVSKLSFVVASICLVAYGSHLYSTEASSMKEKAQIAFDATRSPNQILCMSKTVGYFSDDLLTQVFFAPEYYYQCLKKTPSAPNRDFCEFARSEHTFRSRCDKNNIQSWQCTLLHDKALEYC
jgi:hypothetical protein